VSNADQILCAMIEGTARGLATDKEVAEAEAVRRLRALAAGRADLLAEAGASRSASAVTIRPSGLRAEPVSYALRQARIRTV
jgi:citrate lyase beta subunit